MLTTIFCPHCSRLVLDATRCPHCGGWERPVAPPVERGAITWQVDLPAALDSDLTLANGVIYAGDADGKLHALDAATGEPRWPKLVDLGAWRVNRRVAVEAGLVIVGPVDKSPIPAAGKAVLALDAATGREVWRRDFTVRSTSDPLVVGDTAYLSTSDGHAVALAMADGSVRWRKPVEGVGLAAPAHADGLIVYSGEKGTLAAVHRADGTRAWNFIADRDEEWGAAFRYSAVVADGVSYATCWNRRCYALEARTGVLVWASEPAKRPPMTPPLVTSDAVCFCGHDRFVYCLARSDGVLRWRTQLPRMSRTTPVIIEGLVYVTSEDHRVYSLDATTGTAMGEPLLVTSRHVAADWATDGEHLYLGDCDGHLVSLTVSVPQVETAPSRLEASGRWMEAAAQWALTRDFRRAAEIYRDRLGLPCCAAQLFERAGDKPAAAMQYEQAAEIADARRLYDNLGQHLKVAELSERLGEFLPAAQAFERADCPAEAARLYARLAMRLPAAELYERAADAAGRASDGAQEKGWWSRAAEQWTALECWDSAASAWDRAEEFARAGEAWQKGGDCLKAARDLWKAAEQAQAQHQGIEAAFLYERSMQLFHECGDEERERDCDLQRRYLRRQPLLDLALPQVDPFTEGQSGRINVVVANVGWGQAHRIKLGIRPSKDFRADDTRVGQEYGLAPDYQKKAPLWVIPLRAADALPLHLTVAYAADPGSATSFILDQSFDIPVRPRPVRRGSVVAETYVERAEGDVVAGDQVKIARGATMPPNSPQGDSRHEADQTHQVTCPACHTGQSANQIKCSKCGIPFVRCRDCRRAMPGRADFCPHCSAQQ